MNTQKQVLVLAATTATLAYVIMGEPTRVVNMKPAPLVVVVKSEQAPSPGPSNATLDGIVGPTGSSRCADQIKVLLNMSRTCFGNISQNASENVFWCQNRLGCRETLRAPIRNVALACKPDDQLRSGAIQILNRILQATRSACSESNESCDVQAALVNDMLLMNSNQSEFRDLACSSCVKKSLGRMALKNGSSNHPEVYAKVQCNKINEKYCTLSHGQLPSRICEPCYQRSISKTISADRLRGIKSDSEYLLRACYDDGTGGSCFSRVMGILMTSNNLTNINSASFEKYSTLQACQKQNACADPQCQSALQSLIDSAGCCASAVPAALLGGVNLPCLRTMVDSKPNCEGPYNYDVAVTLKTADSVESVCRLVQEDLATTLATTSDMISCKNSTSKWDRPDQGIITVLAQVQRVRSIGMQFDVVLFSPELIAAGMPSRVQFDPDLLQDPILQVETMAVW